MVTLTLTDSQQILCSGPAEYRQWIVETWEGYTAAACARKYVATVAAMILCVKYSPLIDLSVDN